MKAFFCSAKEEKVEGWKTEECIFFYSSPNFYVTKNVQKVELLFHPFQSNANYIKCWFDGRII